ncbi:MAG: hypothetical protein LBK63_11320 [Treponema sp.]|jgi:hypothetical protein|nr:hypothetical protein [Treponema sp.]
MTLPVIFSAASLLICVFGFIGLLRYIRLRTGARHILEEVEDEVNKLIAGINAITDRDITLLEDKSAAVKAMLETLDRRLAAYARELERREKQGAALDALASGPGAQTARTEGTYAALGRGIRSSLRVDAPEPLPSPSGSTAPFVPGAFALPGPAEPSGPVEPSGAAPSAPVEPSSPAPPGEPAPEGPSPQPQFTRSANPVRPRASLSEQAQELHRNGFSPETIAVRLGATVAEVNLALALALPDSPLDS